jgi:hypothetical protein
MNLHRFGVFLTASDPSSAARSVDGWHKFLAFLNTYPDAITSIATVVLVIVTVVYVVFTWKLVKEAQRDRDVAYQPILGWNISHDGATYKAKTVNNSPAGAFQCILVAMVNNASVLMRTDPFDLDHGGEILNEMVRADTAQPSGLDLSVARAFCQNQFGHIFFYKQGTIETSVWRPSTKHWPWRRKPAWATWYQGILKAFWDSKVI